MRGRREVSQDPRLSAIPPVSDPAVAVAANSPKIAGGRGAGSTGQGGRGTREPAGPQPGPCRFPATPGARGARTQLVPRRHQGPEAVLGKDRGEGEGA